MRALAACLLWVLAGCAAAPPPSREPAAARHRRHRRRRAASASDPCAALRAESRAAVARALGARPASTWPTLAALDQCVASPRGAWGLRVEALAVERDPDTRAEVISGTFSLVHLAADGARVGVRLWSEGDAGPEGNFTCAANDECVSVDPLSVFDHDGDGEPEVFVRVSTERHGAASTSRGRVWTFRDGAIDVYAPARAWVVEAVRDVDGDGRPDLLTRGRYLGEAPGPCGRQPHTVVGPLLAVHSLAGGGFSVDDAAARRADREACPAASAAVAGLASAAAEGEGASSVYARAVCARLWGASADAVRAVVRASPWAERVSGRRCASLVRASDADVLLDWAAQPPPVDLRR